MPTYLFLICSTLFVAQAQAQKDSVQNLSVSELYKTIDTININSLLGDWELIDNPTHIIHFEKNAYYADLVVDSTFTYSFSFIDSLGNCSSQGWKINWPPYYVYITEIKSDEIELRFASFGSKTSLMRRYKRKTRQEK
jgi:hypothetical protein